MQIEFRKDGYNFEATTPDGYRLEIKNVSTNKYIRSLSNWVVSDQGFHYETEWQGAKYFIAPSFTGNGYIISTKDGVVGKTTTDFKGALKIKNTKLGANIDVVESQVKEYRVLNGKSEVGIVRSTGGMFNWVLSIDLAETSQPAAHLLVFMALVKNML